MTGYSSTPLAKKLGIKEQFRILAAGAPEGYRQHLEPLPAMVRFVSKADRSTNLVHIFHTKRSRLLSALAGYRDKLDPSAIVWVSWPKKSAGVPSEITEDVVRELALPLGYVDVKVCAVDDVGSGLKLVVRKALR